MESLNTSRPNKGFTLVEVLISLGIVVVVLSLGLFLSFDFYKSHAFRSEKSIIVSILQRARGQALANINEKSHGVHFEANPSLKYISFEGPVYNPGNPNNIIYEAAYGISITSPALPFDVIFSQLDGSSVNTNITLTANGVSYDVSVNEEGRINW